MSEATLEREIISKVKEQSGKTYKRKDLMEWRCGKGITPRDDEVIYFIESMDIEVAFKKQQISEGKK